ncbi:STAS-like domain-containing protein [Veillonella parvula]|uniref:STAS-like domain-containing protein n=1 Tax=Veillonella parvula TaxID=29466 RepID=UPI0026EA7D0D|nr:DUF4325 domain-containing protein [Veillonella parvula]
MTLINLSIARDFSITPGGRKASEGKYSGEEFRKNFLEPKIKAAMQSRSVVNCDLDGCLGYPSSFLDESFGVLGRELKAKKIDIFDYLNLKCEDEPSLISEITKYIQGV